MRMAESMYMTAPLLVHEMTCCYRCGIGILLHCSSIYFAWRIAVQKRLYNYRIAKELYSVLIRVANCVQKENHVYI